MSAERVTISGHRKLFHDQMKARITLVAIAAFGSGIIMRKTIRHSRKPVDPRRVDQRARHRLEARLEDEDADDGREQRQREAEIGVEQPEPAGDQIGRDDGRLEGDQHAGQEQQQRPARLPAKCLVSA